jgi:hypothetical protein
MLLFKEPFTTETQRRRLMAGDRLGLLSGRVLER